MLRPGTVEDAAFLVDAILHASRSHLEAGPFDKMLDDPAQVRSVLEWMVISPVPSTCRADCFWVLQREGPAAALSLYDPMDEGMDNLTPALVESFESNYLEDLIEGALERMLPFRECAPDLDPDAVTLEWVATAPERRGVGLGAELVERSLKIARERGYSAAQVAFMIGNERARRLYERCGFRMLEERRSHTFEYSFGAPGMARMSCVL